MRLRVIIMALALCLVGGGAAWAQQTGDITGKVVDASGGVVPGVTVTLSSPVLIAPATAVSSSTGTYQFPRIPIGTYTVKFELTGFKTVVREGIRIEIGFTAQINATMEVSSHEETVTVSGAAPIVDLRDTSKGAHFTQEALQSIPSARDPWVIIEQAAGVAMDRQNVGGSASGQQSNFVARGAAFREQKWNLDGVDITDMSATGGSPGYFDFDSFEEMQVTTGGSNAGMQTPGVAVNIVTKSGTDRFKGSMRAYITNDAVESVNVTDAMRVQGASSGNPIQDIRDYGIEIGGPLVKGRAWFWGAFGKQDVKVGINNFYSNATPACSQIKSDYARVGKDLTQAQFVGMYTVNQLWDCLNTDLTTLNNYNLKIGVDPFKNNHFSWYNNFAGKIRNARGADDLHPIESTNRQMGVTSNYGAWGWKTGINGTWKASDQHIFSDRLMAEVTWAHVGNNFIMAYHDDSLANVQAEYELTTGAYARSYSQNVYVRPTNSVDTVVNYFKPGWLGGDHSIKVGYKWRSDEAYSDTTWGGSVQARFNSGNKGNFVTPYSARFYRESITDYYLYQQAGYIQDNFTRKRLTLNLGFRWDRQHDAADPAQVPGSPFQGQVMGDGTVFTFLPAVNFPGASDGVIWNDFAPRLGLTYDLLGDGRTVLKASFARYYSQRGTGDISSTINTIAATYVEYPWNDANGDKVVQINEVNTSKLIGSGGNYNALNPASTVSANKIDPNISNQRTNEFLVSFDRQVSADWGLSGSFIYRKYSNYRTNYNFDQTTGRIMVPSDWTASTWTPGATDCPVSGARCPTSGVIYYQPNFSIPTALEYTNIPDYYQTYKGLEFSARKRMSHRWMMNASAAWNDTPMFYPTPASYGAAAAGQIWSSSINGFASDPTNIQNFNGAQYAPQSSSSGIDNVFVNAKWVARLTGAYQLPWYDIGVAGFYNARSGYPFMQQINITTRSNRAGAIGVLLDPIGDVRLPTFQTVDFRVDKTFTVAKTWKIQAGMDIFNLLNSNTILSERRNQNANNANQISSILSPRVLRFGVRITF